MYCAVVAVVVAVVAVVVVVVVVTVEVVEVVVVVVVVVVEGQIISLETATAPNRAGHIEPAIVLGKLRLHCESTGLQRTISSLRTGPGCAKAARVLPSPKVIIWRKLFGPSRFAPYIIVLVSRSSSSQLRTKLSP